MIKLAKKYPIEIALEKGFNKISDALVYAIRTPIKFWFTIPKRKDDKQFKMIEIIGIYLIAIGWLMITFSRIHWFGL